MTEQQGGSEPTPPPTPPTPPPTPPTPIPPPTPVPSPTPPPTAPPPTAPPAPPNAQAPYPPYGHQQPHPYAQSHPGQTTPGYGFVVPGPRIPGQIDPETGLVFSDKERLTAGLLQLVPCLVGLPGIGRLYTGYLAIGLVQLIGATIGLVLTCILIGLPLWIGMVIWGVVDGIRMLTNRRFTDAEGRLLR